LTNKGGGRRSGPLTSEVKNKTLESKGAIFCWVWRKKDFKKPLWREQRKLKNLRPAEDLKHGG